MDLSPYISIALLLNIGARKTDGKFIYANETTITCGSEVTLTFNKSTDGHLRILFLRAKSPSLINIENPKSDFLVGIYIEFDEGKVDNIQYFSKVEGIESDPIDLFKDKTRFEHDVHLVLSVLIQKRDLIISIQGIAAPKIIHSEAWRQIGSIHFSGTPGNVIEKDFTVAVEHRTFYSSRKNHHFWSSFVSNRHQTTDKREQLVTNWRKQIIYNDD